MISSCSIALMLTAALLAACAQLLLKKSAMREHRSPLLEYLNLRVSGGYALLMVSALLMILAYRESDYKLGPVLGSTSYVYVMLISRFILRERIPTSRWIGCALVICGIVVFNG